MLNLRLYCDAPLWLRCRNCVQINMHPGSRGTGGKGCWMGKAGPPSPLHTLGGDPGDAAMGLVATALAGDAPTPPGPKRRDAPMRTPPAMRLPGLMLTVTRPLGPLVARDLCLSPRPCRCRPGLLFAVQGLLFMTPGACVYVAPGRVFAAKGLCFVAREACGLLLVVLPLDHACRRLPLMCTVLCCRCRSPRSCGRWRHPNQAPSSRGGL